MTADVETNLALVVTSIARPTPAMRNLAQGAKGRGISFICIGDEKSPDEFALEGCKFVSLLEQAELPFQITKYLPVRHYARKNIGYLLAMKAGAQRILETDDDNTPLADFWEARQKTVMGDLVAKSGWLNVYAFFTDDLVWPRGFPLEQVLRPSTRVSSNAVAGSFECPIQQGLANGDTDVDAIYRLTRNNRIEFRRRTTVVAEIGTWCPFNSQSTFWWPEAYSLMYLPSHCSFRTTDIWRSFVAQACLWANGWRVAFVGPVMRQDRNEHNLLRDFEQEVDGYLHNARIAERLIELDLKAGDEALFENLLRCYRCLAELELVGKHELRLLDAWLTDVSSVLSVTT